MRRQSLTGKGWGRRLALAALLLLPFLSHAQTGTWRAYMSYYEPQQIVKCDDQLFVRASDGLYSYNMNDQSIETYDKVNRLNDTHITMIGLNRDTKKLLIVYQNQNMDIMDCQTHEVENLSALYLKSMTTDKTVYAISMQGQYAYLACGFGIVKVNMKKDEIADSYILGNKVTGVGISGDNIYARYGDGSITTAPLKSNLIDPNNWKPTTDVPAGIFDIDTSDWQQYQSLVATLKPGGPKANKFSHMLFKHNRLYTVGGGFTAAMDLEYDAVAQVLHNGEWTILQDNIQDITGWQYKDAEAIDADPADPEHIFVGTRSGLYEFRGRQFVKGYNINNSPLSTATTDNQESYVLVFGVKYDNEGKLWLINGNNYNFESIFEMTPDGQFISHKKEQLINENKSLKGLRTLVMDSRGYLWFLNEHWTIPSFYCYIPETDRLISFTSLTNQDGTTIDDYNPHCIAEDLEGNIWVGTAKGPVVVEKQDIGKDNATVTQVKVPRNDGTNYADYLLDGTNIRSIVVDGGGRKWFGTENNGIYLISADNMTELAHYTTMNSGIISDNVYSLAINNDTGELFIGTDEGLCSLMTDATTAVDDMTKDDVYAFPNPVASGYQGLITVRGLSIDSDVKVLTTSGKLVAQGRSNGGTFTWDGRDSSGRRVASGVYMVAAAKKDGSRGTVCKIAIIN